MLVSAMWGEVPSAVLVGWYSAQMAYQVVRTLVYRAYWRAPPSAEAASKWIRLWVLQAMTNGCIWGSAGLLFFSPIAAEEPYRFLVTEPYRLALFFRLAWLGHDSNEGILYFRCWHAQAKRHH